LHKTQMPLPGLPLPVPNHSITDLPIPGLEFTTLPKPKIGDIKKGWAIGKKCKKGYFVWSACSTCTTERWVRLEKGLPLNELCHVCAMRKVGKIKSMENNPHWRGGRKTKGNYIMVKLAPDDFFYAMCNKEGYAYEHRLVMARHLGRCLQPWEIVHHKGIKFPKGSLENKQHNVIENLQFVTDDRHRQITIMELKIDRLLEGQRELMQEIRLLRLQNKILLEREGYPHV